VPEGRQRNRVSFGGMVRGMKNAWEAPKILTLLFRPRLVCRACSYISELVEGRFCELLRLVRVLRCSA
jgi:hypothetical protein